MTCNRLLVLLVVVDLVVPEESLSCGSGKGSGYMCRFKAYLVTVSPEEVLGADVLVGVLRPLRAGMLVLLVGNVLPVGVPPHLGVDAGNDDAGDSNAVDRVSNCCLGNEAVLELSRLRDAATIEPNVVSIPGAIQCFLPTKSRNDLVPPLPLSSSRFPSSLSEK